MLLEYRNEEFEDLSYLIQLNKKGWDDGVLTNKNIIHYCRDWLDVRNSNKLEMWSGYISKQAMKAYLNDTPRIVQREHSLPVQIVLPSLFNEQFDIAKDPKKLEEFYLAEYGIFNLVTRQENSELKSFQTPETFINPESSYKSAGIELVDCNSMRDYLFTERTGRGQWYHRPNKGKLEHLLK